MSAPYNVIPDHRAEYALIILKINYLFGIELDYLEKKTTEEETKTSNEGRDSWQN